MTTITIRPVDADQETLIKLYLDALHADYTISGDNVDEKVVLSASLVLKEQMEKDAEAGEDDEEEIVNVDEV